MLSQTTLFKSDIRPTNHIFKADRPIVDLLDQQNRSFAFELVQFSRVGWARQFFNQSYTNLSSNPPHVALVCPTGRSCLLDSPYRLPLVPIAQLMTNLQSYASSKSLSVSPDFLYPRTSTMTSHSLKLQHLT